MAARNRLLGNYAIIILVWILIAIFIFLQESVASYGAPGQSGKFASFMEVRLPGYIIWAFLTPFIFYISRKFPFRRGRIIRSVLASFGLSLIVFTVYAGCEMLVYIVNIDYPSSYEGYLPFIAKMIASRITSLSFIFWAILAIGHIFQHQKELADQEIKTAKLEKALVEARLNALKMKLNPHFLFNSLNAVSSLAADNNTDGVRDLISLIGSMLRRLLDTDLHQLHSVAGEMEILQNYILIEKYRFKGRLHYEEEIDPEAENCRIPTFLLQPLVENSIKHGLSKSLDACLIRVRIERGEGRLLIQVMDDGPGLPEVWTLESNAGVGLSGVYERLELLYEKDFTLKFGNREPTGILLEISIPCSLQGENL